eukprot:scaffold3669_cov68-Cylindrotheca_fusiformis.AAC.3
MDDVTVLFAITDELFDFLFEDEGNRCFDGFDVDSLMDNPFQAVDNRCTTIESVTFNDALDEFQVCSGFDLNELIETFGSVFLGILLNCGAYEIGVAKSFDGMENIDRMKQQDSLFPRVNPECVDALVGDNPFAQSLLSVEKFPTTEMTCFSDLSKRLPSCTLSEWPIPIVGSWLKIMVCLFSGSLDLEVDVWECQHRLEALSICLPENDSITKSSCKDIRNECVFGVRYINAAPPMAMPPPFWAMPLGQRCKEPLARADTSLLEQYMSLLGRYETYRNVCIPAADRAIWDDFKSPKQQNKSGNGRGGASSGFLDAASKEMSSSTANKTTGSSSSKFVPGFFVGLIIAFSAMFGLQKLKSSKKGADPAFNMDYVFHSLELTESLR